MTTELLRLTARGTQGVFIVRQRGRQVSQAVGFDQPDRVRIATALSEVCRQLLPAARSCTVTFELSGSPPDRLLVTLRTSTAVPAAVPVSEDLTEAVRAASRLMDTVELTEQAGHVVVCLARRMPPQSLPGGTAQIEAVRVALGAEPPASALEELGAQNQQLIATLDEVQSQRDQLLRLNAELEETNRGVMALYGQLSDELEQTNRGVVALYAELDERSAQLREASEAKSRFLRNVSHELRAPVTATVGMLRLLLDPRADPLTAEQVRQLTLVDRSMKDLLAMISQLLDLARAESNRLEPVWSQVDLASVFSQLRGALLPLAHAGVELVVEDPAGVPPIVTDEVMLVQILRNLLTNGLKFTLSGEVRLTATASESHTSGSRTSVAPEAGPGVVLTVSDTGIGIPADEQAKVFEEFYQVRGRHQRPGVGTGLGLPYARRLCALLGAALELRSAPGAGTTLTVTLPARPSGVDSVPPVPAATPPAPAATPAPPVSPSAGRPLGHVLVVDDDAAFRGRLRLALGELADTVEEACDGQEAYQAMRAHTPDAVLLDLRMPRMSGTELLALLAEDGALRDVPVLAVTAAELDEGDRRAMSHAVGVLDKTTLTDEDLARALRGIRRHPG